MGPRCSSAETQVCHRNYIIAASFHPDGPGSNPSIGAKVVMDGPWEEENKICYVDPPCQWYIVDHKIK